MPMRPHPPPTQYTHAHVHTEAQVEYHRCIHHVLLADTQCNKYKINDRNRSPASCACMESARARDVAPLPRERGVGTTLRLRRLAQTVFPSSAARGARSLGAAPRGGGCIWPLVLLRRTSQYGETCFLRFGACWRPHLKWSLMGSTNWRGKWDRRLGRCTGCARDRDSVA